LNYSVRYIDLPKQYQVLREEIQECLERVFSQGSFILRDDVAEFEAQMAQFLGVKHVVGLNSGTDALYLSARALGIGPGDEVITVAHTFVATIAAIVHCGATPVLVDIGDDFNMDISRIEAAITPRTKAIIPVHLNGRVCRMDVLMEVAAGHNLTVIEDAAQALSASYDGRAAGSFGNTGCFSLHPLKNLSVGGDGGFVSTDDDRIAAELRLLRDHGQLSKEEISFYGFNSRLDNLHAALALVKLKYLPEWIERRRILAAKYDELLRPIEKLVLPPPPDDSSAYYDVFSSFVVRTQERNALKHHLEENGVEVFVNWPKPLHQQEQLDLGNWKLPVTERMSKEVLSLPLYPELTDEDQEKVVSAILNFFEN